MSHSPPVMAEVFAQGACTGPEELIQTREAVPGMIFGCIDLVIAALGQDVKGYFLAHGFAAQMGTVRIFPLLFTKGFSLFFRDRIIICTPNFSDWCTCEVVDPPPKPQGRHHRGEAALGTEQEQLAQ